MNEVRLVICQDCDAPPKVSTLLLTGDAVLESPQFDHDVFLPGFLFSKKTQTKGQLLFLTGVCKIDGSADWSPCTVQVCDGNVLAWNCMSGTRIYDAKHLGVDESS